MRQTSAANGQTDGSTCNPQPVSHHQRHDSLPRSRQVLPRLAQRPHASHPACQEDQGCQLASRWLPVFSPPPGREDSPSGCNARRSSARCRENLLASRQISQFHESLRGHSGSLGGEALSALWRLSRGPARGRREGVLMSGRCL